jgi:trigger factor
MSESTEAPASPAVAAAIEDAGTCRKKIRITVPPERVREELDRAFLDVIRHAQVPGFRPGHLPRKVAEMRFGKAVREEVRGSLLEAAFGEVVEREKLEPLGSPDLKGGDGELDPAKSFEFEVLLEVRPVVTIPDLKSLSVRRVQAAVEDGDVDRAVEELRLDRAELRPAEDGVVGERDVIVVDVAVFAGGARVDGAENVELRHPSEVVAGVAVPGVAKAILGKKAGDELALPVTLPARFRSAEHAGKPAEIRLAVREVKRFHLPPLDDAFAKAHDFDSVDDLRAGARKAVARGKEAEAEKALEAAMLDSILEKAPIPLPEGIVHKEIENVLRRYQAELHMQGAPEEAIEEKLAEIQADAEKHVQRELRVAFLVDALSKAKGVLVTEGEVAEQVGLMAGRYGRPSEEMRRYLEERQLLPSLRSRIRERKVLEAIRKEIRVEA